MLDVGVIGGGLCGLATAHALLRSGRAAVTLYDPMMHAPALGYARTASAVAGGLLHPLGPSLRPAWDGAGALRQADALIADAERRAGVSVVAADAVLRPAADAADAAALAAAALAAGPDWLEFLDADAFAATAGRGDFSHGGVRIVGGRCVDARAYLAALRDACASRAGFAAVPTVVADPAALGHDAVVLCGGADAYRDHGGRYFPAGLSLTRGESLLYGAAADAALLRGDYLCPAAPGTAILGATRDPVAPESPAFDAEPRPLDDLRAALAGAADALAPPGNAPEVLGATAGVRLNGPRTHLGRLPFVSKRGDVWVAGALGARGLLRHAQVGNAVADALLHDDLGRVPAPLRAPEPEGGGGS